MPSLVPSGQSFTDLIPDAHRPEKSRHSLYGYIGVSFVMDLRFLYTALDPKA